MLPILLFAGAFVLRDGAGEARLPARSRAGAAPSAQPEPATATPIAEAAAPVAAPASDVAATFAALLDRAPTGPILDALSSEADRERVRKALQDVYERRGYRPIWLREGRPSRAARDLVATLDDASEVGLDPRAYHADLLARRLDALGRRSAPPGALETDAIETDALLSQALLVYGEHLATGRVDPLSLGPAWLLEPRDPDLAPSLEAVAATGELEPALEPLRPPHAGYRELQRALGSYREIRRTGGWPTVSEGPVLSAGDTASRERLRTLALRLEAEGDLPRGSGRPEAPEGAAEAGPTGDADAPAQALYDETLAAAVERFQARLGLTVDGKVGPKTVAALDRSASHRVRQIELNLERWRWLPADLGARRIEVNLPAFMLDTVEDDRVTSSMKVVVGKAGAATPAFSDQMTYLVINPYWNVPASIVAREIAPEALRDPGYLAAHDFEVISGWGAGERTVSPYAVDWAAARDGRWQYRVRQRPGPGNSLGQIKFMFPNDHNIYLHDTPATHLFDEARRTFSHGCIRVEHPLDLAAFALRGDPRWDRDRVRSTIASGRQVQVNLAEPLPVYLLYWTAWVDDGGTVHFRDDVYGHDRALDAALDRL